MEIESTIQTIAAPKEEEQSFALDYNLLEDYYRYYFPFNQMYQWLSYPHNGDSSYFGRREFSLTLGDDIYVRYQMVNDEKELRNLLLSKVPQKIDIGAVFNKQGKKGDDIQAVEKEFVIDIDMTDYDSIRTCCSKAKICPKCWKFMRFACQIISESLKEDFGFEHVLWVYSGRRGIHAWICDKQMRKANDKTRIAVIDYLNIVVDNAQSSSYVKQSILKMERNYLIDRNALKPQTQGQSEAMVKKMEFESERDFREIILQDQDLFAKRPKIILDFLTKRSEELSKAVEQEWRGIANSEDRYESLKEQVFSFKKKDPRKVLHNILEELKIWLLYPRLDVNVSKSTNHLLKSPFCIHPKTGNVCVPFTSEEILKFNPFLVPNITTLKTEQGIKVMKECLSTFNNFLETLKQDV